MRTFISIDLNKETKDEIKRVQNSLPVFAGKKTEVESLHLTLKFLGEIDEYVLKRVEESLKKINFRKFKVKLGEIGFFKENFIKIVWIELKNCEELQKEIDDNLRNYFSKEEKFMPHITIARVKQIEDPDFFKKQLKKIKVKEVEFEVDKFKLKESKLRKEWPRYTDLGIYKLH
jgi:2'-5' RNA ligase